MTNPGVIVILSLGDSGFVMLELFPPFPVGKICAVIFVLAWIGQFIGHKIEGKKRAFLHDLVFLLIGPAWLMSKIYAKIGQRYRACPVAIRGGAVANAVFAPCAPDSSDRASCG